jgi:hypothetical protein
LTDTKDTIASHTTYSTIQLTTYYYSSSYYPIAAIIAHPSASTTTTAVTITTIDIAILAIVAIEAQRL